MRSVQLKRGNRVVTDMDLYDLLVGGDKSKDAPLLPGDVIYFPPIGPLAAVSGSINVPAVYELKSGASLGELIRWAGGLATTAEGQRVVVERIENRRTRKVEEFSLDATGLARTVRDGDLVTVRALVPRFENAVTLRGNVAQPGRFPWREGMRVRDLIPEKEALLSREYLLRQNQLVGLDNNVARLVGEQSAARTDPGAREMSVRDLAERKLQEGEDVTVGEAIRRRQIERDALQMAGPEVGRPEAARRLDQARLVNQIRPSLKEVNWDYALIERVRPDDLTTSLVPFNLGKAIIQGDPQHNLLLQPGDVITIFSKEDLQVPAQRQTKYIKLEGEFASPGVYQIEPGETLRQLVARVGGLSQGAYLFGSELTRVSTRRAQESQYQETLNRLERESEGDAAARARNVSPEDAQLLPAQQAARRALFARMRELKPSGRIVLELPESAKLTDLLDISLEDGDRFFVPPQPSTVNVFGAVFSEASFLYRPEKRAADYLALAGGTTKRADTSQIFVLKADGSVAGAGRSWFGARTVSTNVMPGDSIVVPEDYERTTWVKDLRDWTQILYQFGLGAAGLKVLRGN
jgi:protein involved in polysaccharide export with SLBB domain